MDDRMKHETVELNTKIASLFRTNKKVIQTEIYPIKMALHSLSFQLK